MTGSELLAIGLCVAGPALLGYVCAWLQLNEGLGLAIVVFVLGISVLVASTLALLIGSPA